MALRVYRELQSGLQFIGTLDGERRDDATFRYSDTYLDSANARPISFSLPLTGRAFAGEEVRPYFDGLLPEGPARRSLAAEIGCREEDFPVLLEHCGLDCIGDVVINPEAFSGERSYEPVNLREVASRRPQPSAIAQLLGSSRLSIAGAQGKTGLYHDASRDAGEGWYQPVGGAPSNVIVKFANEEIPDLVELEYLCLMAARACGIDMPDASLMFPGRPTLCVNRFDRTVSSGVVIGGLPAPVRQHQEDLAQALSIASASKYAELAPSTIEAVSSFIVEHSSSPALDIASFARMVVFNYAIGNCDNHLKNYSVLYSPNWDAVRLAPAYDLISTAHYRSFSTEMGMAFGGTRRLEEIEADDILALAGQLGVSARSVKRIADEVASSVVPGFIGAAAQIAAQGFDDAPYLVDELEEELAPRLDVLARAANA